MLKNLTLHGVVGCFLLPSHAGLVAAALDKLLPQQALIVLQPEEQDLRVLLASCDFSSDIRRNRLWIAAGPDWQGMARTLFDRAPGLPTPAQFIKTAVSAEEATAALIPLAEKLFGDVNEQRASQLTSNGQSVVSVARKPLLVIAPTHFRLWDDAADALLTALSDESENIAHLDPDDPAQASALGLSIAANSKRAVIVANRGRADLPDVLGREVPLIAWITEPRLPPFNSQYPRDLLILADEAWRAPAKAAGWPASQLHVASWPRAALPPAPASPSIALIGDARSLETPITELELSSHHILWEMIRSDLAHDPLSLGSDIDAFLNRRMAKLGIAAEGFDRVRFVQQLILPAYQQGLARILLNAGLPLKLFGRGWDELPSLREAWAGPILDRDAFGAAVADASVLVYAWPARSAHAIDGLGRPVLWVPSRDPNQWVRAARGLLRGPPAAPPPQPSINAVLSSIIS